MSTISIGKLCELKYGKSLRKDKRIHGVVPVYGSNGIVDYHHEGLVENETIIVGRKGSIGEVHFVNGPSWPIDTTYFVVLKNDYQVDLKWFYRILGSLKLTGLNRSAAIPGLNRDDVYRIKIHLPPLNDQICIAQLLAKVEGLIDQRKENLQQLDELLKSVFWEMFGDIKAKQSVHKWEKPRPYLTASSGKSSTGVKCSEKTEFPIYGGNGVNGWASKPLYEEPIVVAGRVGQQCGIIHVSKGPCWVTDNAIALTITDHSKLNITYLATAFQNAPIREKVKQLDLPFINQSMLLDFPIPIPPIGMQNQFAVIVEKVEGIKSHYQETLTGLECLYGALSQKAFKGELDLSRVSLSAAADMSVSDQLHSDKQDDEKPKNIKADAAKSIDNIGKLASFTNKSFEEFISARKGDVITATALWQELIQVTIENQPPNFEIFKKLVMDYLDEGRWLEQVYAEVPVDDDVDGSKVEKLKEKKVALRIRDDS